LAMILDSWKFADIVKKMPNEVDNSRVG